MAAFQNSCRLYGFLILAALAGGACSCPVYAADEIDPFQVDSGHWMSFERYNDNLKRNRPVGNEALNPTPAPAKVELPDLSAPPSPPESGAATNVTTPSPAYVVAAPTRPLDLPILPGINKGFDLAVSSTADQSNATSPAQIVNTPSGETDLHLQEQNWQEAAKIAQLHADDKNSAEHDNEHSPLNVRMTFLPDSKITPVTNPERKPRLRVAEVPMKPKSAPAAKPAECAAIDLYKKKQLEAIQSDRQTLEALQSAIHDLGLQKQLNFMTGAEGEVVNASTQNQTPAPSAATGMP